MIPTEKKLNDSGSIQLRRALPIDFEITWKWLQDPQAREAINLLKNEKSFEDLPFRLNQQNAGRPNLLSDEDPLQSLTREEHFVWFASRINDPHCIYLICELNEVPIGQLRIDKKSDLGQISVIVEEEQRGKGYGTSIIQLGCRYAYYSFNLHRFIARVKKEVPGAIKPFERSGFIVAKELTVNGTKAVELQFDMV
jgi:RimJ/RimL family protein N-acetyltransferase